MDNYTFYPRKRNELYLQVAVYICPDMGTIRVDGPSHIISSKIRRLVSEDCILQVDREDAQHQSLSGARILIT